MKSLNSLMEMPKDEKVEKVAKEEKKEKEETKAKQADDPEEAPLVAGRGSKNFAVEVIPSNFIILYGTKLY